MKYFVILLLIAGVVGLPFLLEKPGETIGDSEDTVVVITPHNEAIRFEFENKFREWYEGKTGRTVDVDWRTIGGTSQIVRYIQSEFENAFRNYWINELDRDWTGEVAASFDDPDVELPQEGDLNGMTSAMEARKAFLESDVSVGMDIFFGGGSYEFQRQSGKGNLVAWETGEELEERFPPDIFPQKFAGEVFWDPQGKWIGAVLSSFGIIYNVDSIKRLGIREPPTAWTDLANPRFFGEVALADPTKSGSMTKAFEMIVQEQMHRSVDAAKQEGLSVEAAEERGLAEGWMNAMKLIQKIAANSRYFTDSATKVPMDVADGDSAVGMCIDFYGRFQAQVVEMRGGGDRVRYVTPQGASTLSADPIGILRGAPNREVADLFMEFVLSNPGQQLWGQRVGTEGGPIEYALRRSPAFRTMYEPPFRELLSEPEVNPYEQVGNFVYRPDWTGRLFTPLRFIIRVAFIDPKDELSRAWEAILAARERGDVAVAEEAERILSDLGVIDFEQASGPIKNTLSDGDAIDEVRLARELADRFRAQYERARKVADGG